jgi:hypothetical protein
MIGTGSNVHFESVPKTFAFARAGPVRQLDAHFVSDAVFTSITCGAVSDRFCMSDSCMFQRSVFGLPVG